MAENKLVATSGEGIGRTVFARLEPGADLIEGIKEVCRKHEINNGVILCCIGSLKNVVFSYGKIVHDKNLPHNDSAGLVIEGPASLLACQGVVCRHVPGDDLSVHLHGSIQDNDLRVWGQDFAETGNIVFNTVDLVIAELGLEMVRRTDPVLPGLITSPRK